MNRYFILFLSAIMAITVVYYGDIINKEIQNFDHDFNHDVYSGYPRYPVSDKSFKLNSSIVEDPEIINESLNSKPCLMTMRVSENFLNGYKDGINKFIKNPLNKTKEYIDGYDLANKDIKEGTIRRLEAIMQK